MKKPLQIEFESENVKCYLAGEVAVLKITCNAFGTLTNLDQANRVLPWFDMVENDPSVKAIVGMSEKDCLGETAYEEFLSEITGRSIQRDKYNEITRFEKSDIRAIEINMLINLIRKIYSFKKIFISAINGEIVTPFLGLSLVSDFRFASSDLKIMFSHVKYGLHPSGAIPFFLPKFINKQLAMKYMLQGGVINFEEAVKLNLVNELVDDSEFEKNSIEKAKEYIKMGMSTLKNTKSLINSNSDELENYFKIESNYTYK